jgi:group 4 capsule polysaccharide lipoprotein GfcB/YjbF
MRLVFGIFLILSTTVACGSKSEDGPGLRQTLVAAIKAKKEAKKAEGLPKAPPPVLTRQAISNIEKPLMQISAQTLGVKTLFAQVAQNGPYRTYLNNLKMSVTFNNGIITATRGFGLDLLSQGISILPEDMFTETNAPKFYTRTQQQLAKVKTVVEIDYNCTLEKGEAETITIVEIDYDLIKYTETCRNSERAFNNYYWVDDKTKQIWKSAQSIGQEAGFFIAEVLVP